jgi:formylglycine-generating enzyme required for sulfatase activity
MMSKPTIHEGLYVGMFVEITAGRFFMGSPLSEEDREAREPLREVLIEGDFQIADTPVTQAEWEKIMEYNPARYVESGGDAPVENVSWEAAHAFCRTLSGMDSDWVYRLPSEAEWEYACRAGTTGRFNVENASLCDLGWIEENSGGRTHPVREKLPNHWGLYDCHGNVFEWCMDWYDVHFSLQGTPVPDERQTFPGGTRTVKGGCYFGNAAVSRSAFRTGYNATQRFNHIGFRIVRTRR